MYDDYDLEYQFGNDQILDEDMYYEYHARGITSSYEYENDDDEYARDSCDYDTLAYKHYAWYNITPTHENHMYATHQKRMVRVTLDLMCYEDLDVDNLDWSELLGLEGDEDINVTVKDYSDIF